MYKVWITLRDYSTVPNGWICARDARQFTDLLIQRGIPSEVCFCVCEQTGDPGASLPVQCLGAMKRLVPNAVTTTVFTTEPEPKFFVLPESGPEVLERQEAIVRERNEIADRIEKWETDLASGSLTPDKNRTLKHCLKNLDKVLSDTLSTPELRARDKDLLNSVFSHLVRLFPEEVAEAVLADEDRLAKEAQ